MISIMCNTLTFIRAHFPYLVVDRISNPGGDKGTPADAKDGDDVVSGETLTASINN